jgi:hypothetical protein
MAIYHFSSRSSHVPSSVIRCVSVVCVAVLAMTNRISKMPQAFLIIFRI